MRSRYRYLIPVLGAGEPVAATFIFSFSEVFAGFENTTGGVADTLLALVWTQYQYFLFPLIFGFFGVKLLMEDWRQSRDGPDGRMSSAKGNAAALETGQAEVLNPALVTKSAP